MGAQGNTTVNFGAFPGSAEASATITGQAGIVAGSCVEAWIRPEASGDHSADEHRAEAIRVLAGDIVAGAGFTIYAMNDNRLSEPAALPPFSGGVIVNSASAIAWRAATTPGLIRDIGGGLPMPYGEWNVSWVWN
jgi:hypothetical protein